MRAFLVPARDRDGLARAAVRRADVAVFRAAAFSFSSRTNLRSRFTAFLASLAAVFASRALRFSSRQRTSAAWRSLVSVALLRRRAVGADFEVFAIAEAPP